MKFSLCFYSLDISCIISVECNDIRKSDMRGEARRGSSKEGKRSYGGLMTTSDLQNIGNESSDAMSRSHILHNPSPSDLVCLIKTHYYIILHFSQ